MRLQIFLRMYNRRSYTVLMPQVLTERKRLLQKYTEELEIVKALGISLRGVGLCTHHLYVDLDTLVTEAMDAVQNKPSEPTTREDRIKHRLILNPVRSRPLSMSYAVPLRTCKSICGTSRAARTHPR